MRLMKDQNRQPWLNLNCRTPFFEKVICCFLSSEKADRSSLQIVQNGASFRIIDGGFLLLNAYFMDWPKEYLLFTVNLPGTTSSRKITKGTIGT